MINKWSCLPGAFSLATGIPFDQIIFYIGHDGSDILYPKLDEPYCRRSFHIQEVLEAIFAFGFMAMPFEPRPVLGVYVDDLKEHCLDKTKEFKGILSKEKGVLIVTTKRGVPHAVAWNGISCLDPNGMYYPIEYFNINSFWVIRKVYSNAQGTVD